MIDFTNNSKDMMNINSMITFFVRMNQMYSQIIGELVDMENPETADFLAENMPALNDYILEFCCAKNRDPELDAIYEENSPVPSPAILYTILSAFSSVSHMLIGLGRSLASLFV